MSKGGNIVSVTNEYGTFDIVVQCYRRSCVNCDSFDRRAEVCTISNNARPPARVIAYGCNKWVEEDIPF